MHFVIVFAEHDYVITTPVIMNASDADDSFMEWKQSFSVDLPLTASAAVAGGLPLKMTALLWDKDFNSEDDVIGAVDLRLAKLAGAVANRPFQLVKAAALMDKKSSSKVKTSLHLSYSLSGVA